MSIIDPLITRKEMFIEAAKTGTPREEDAITRIEMFLADQYAQGTPVIVMYPLATETTESVTPQRLKTEQGDNVITVTAEVSNIEFEVEYTKEA